MNSSDFASASSRSQRRRMLRPATALVAIAFVLGGCSWMSDRIEGGWFDDGWFDPETYTGGEDMQTSGLSPQAQIDEDAPFPNLATVPDAPPPMMTDEEREQITEGLVADRGNAQYTDETFTGQAENVPAAAPPESNLAGMPTETDALTGEMGGAPEAEMAALPAEGTAAPDYVEPAPLEGEMAALPPAPESMPAMDAMPMGESAVSVDMSALEQQGVNVDSPMPVATSGVGQPIGLIYFGHNSANLNRDARSVLRNIAQIAQSGGTVRIVGHASMRTRTMDLTSHKLANFNVSISRAGAIASELIKLGVSPNQVQIASAGDQVPVYYEFMPTGEAGNRRAEIYLYQ